MPALQETRDEGCLWQHFDCVIRNARTKGAKAGALGRSEAAELRRSRRKTEAPLYRAGPARDWLKVKQRHEGRFIVIGLDVLIYEQRFPTATGCAGSHTPSPKRSVQRVYFFGGETLRSFVTLTTPSVSFANRSASALAWSFGTVPFR
jgi:hypothetical protein